MKAHINEKTTDNYKKAESKIEEILLSVRTKALSVGTKSATKVIYDMATEKGKTDAERIAAIRGFCERTLALPDPSAKKGGTNG
ncbi:MAG: hypothetical protein ACI4KR_07215 [Ruminiclostridium sp.]